MKVDKKIVFIKDWILNYVNSMPVKAQSLVIGISGGIDSSDSIAVRGSSMMAISITGESMIDITLSFSIMMSVGGHDWVSNISVRRGIKGGCA